MRREREREKKREEREKEKREWQLGQRYQHIDYKNIFDTIIINPFLIICVSPIHFLLRS